MKRIDYYAAPNRWPRWLGWTLGGTFGVAAIGAAVLIGYLVKPRLATATAGVAAAPAVASAAPAAAAPTTPATAATPTASAPLAAALPRPDGNEPAPSGSRHGHGHAHKNAPKKPAMSKGQAQAIVARHDNKSSKKERDALDKLLGM